MIKNYKLSIYEIHDDGDLKFVKFLTTNYIPRIGETIEWLIQDEDGKINRRIQYVIKNVVYPCLSSDGNVISHIDNDEIVLHVILEVDEPVFGTYLA